MFKTFRTFEENKKSIITNPKEKVEIEIPPTKLRDSLYKFYFNKLKGDRPGSHQTNGQNVISF